ncbi:Serine/threonine-protein kinase 19 [Podila epigama]|nr:Serine/threonine-protein kinase 19 [Podila epigama]
MSSITAQPLPATTQLQLQLPVDTESAILYLHDILRPHRTKQQKIFPKVCLVHQLYSLIPDHTTVDRSLAQLIQSGKVRKFYLGGTGSDEFAIMLTSDYISLIRLAKQHYLADQQNAIVTTQQASMSSSGGKGHNNEKSSGKRKATSEPVLNHTTDKTCKKRMASVNPQCSLASTVDHNASKAIDGDSPKNNEPMDTIFDRFEQLVSSSSCIEVNIQHSSLRNLIGAIEDNVKTLMQYSLLTRGLSTPANPHLLDLNQRTSSSSSTGSSGGGGGGHHALNQLIATANTEKSKGLASDPSSSSAAQAPVIVPSITRTTIPGAALGAAARGSGKDHLLDNVSYRFAIPKGGLFVTHCLKGRLEILRAIKRQMFGDMLVKTLESKPLRGSSLPHEFHIHDLVGNGRVERY